MNSTFWMTAQETEDELKARAIPPARQELPLTKAELRTLFHVGRELELIACYVPMAAPSKRTVAAQRSYGYDMRREDGRVSTMRFETGNTIVGVSDAGNGFTEVKILDARGEVAAHYRLL